jgi:dihydroflavonol-4-reductase
MSHESQAAPLRGRVERKVPAVTALVTGATGFVGSAVARALLARGETVRVMARAGGDRRNLEGLKVEIVEGDLRDPEARRKALEGAGSLYHVAADYRLWTRDPAAMFAVNVEATENLLREAADAGVSRMVYTSSVATLGLLADGRAADETTPVSAVDMVGPYKRSKFEAEARVRTLARAGVPVVIVNPTAPVGPRDVKPAFVDTGLNIVHVDDVARGHLLAHDKGAIGERYVLGAENLTLQQILARIAAHVNRRPPTMRVPNAAILPIAYAAEFFARVFNTGEPFVTVDGLKLARKRMFFSSAKAQRDLGYTARPVDEALADAIAWFRTHKYL